MSTLPRATALTIKIVFWVLFLATFALTADLLYHTLNFNSNP